MAVAGFDVFLGRLILERLESVRACHGMPVRVWHAKPVRLISLRLPLELMKIKRSLGRRSARCDGHGRGMPWHARTAQQISAAGIHFKQYPPERLEGMYANIILIVALCVG